ncbi:TetR family transcriptional regulator [Mycolicibacterium sp.]|uniref:TetR/AcrR family transcriptional regulator n=1 Tax=Mycolicibacterium sp. TaxID=2320850 RepID=UPI001A1F2BC1|nr:TetR family transcriptional regulator [Mycolicibacterium sp.]MBJ7336404.1 TetR family transcriptional regulator [Mycolicibacterium sp.]
MDDRGRMADKKSPAVRAPLDRERIAATAMEMIDEVGVEKLTMRAVAARLDVSAMALYHHVEDKDELLRLVGDDVLGHIELPDPDSGDWRELFTSISMAAVDALLEVRGLSSVLLSSKMLPNARRLVKFCIYQFERGGLSHAAAQEVYAGVQTLVLGRLLIEESSNFHVSANPHPDDEIRDYISTLRSRTSFYGALTALADRVPS